MFCQNCGFHNPDDAVVCAQCGFDSEATVSVVGGTVEQKVNYEAQSQAIPQQPAYQQPAYQQPAYQQPVYQQPVYQQPVYQQPVYQQPVATATEEPVSVGEWMVSTLICCIPLVGLIMIFVWAFGSNTKKSKANFYKASLVWVGITICLYVIFFVMLGMAFSF